ncbi:creatinine amidohydrolase [Anaerosporomusa subterranea]|uniref:Creatinine amidohydrolase n=1 Tax=Anaerosporomusa subterranea TaxID=1794912 RepID=A0A154BLM1_ANASB|nr:creatininase family protein [Anaerosporomusa subterranea]KYZ74874.1 creatinine amidohydrolase [Anaerosporomusa subterranea]
MSELRSVWLQELTWEDVADYLQEQDIILFPIGSTEQHGPAGPLGVDSYAAISVAEDTARKTQVLVAPPLWYGDSPHHLGFPGTISLTTETLVAVAKDVIRSLAKHGFKKIILLNGHKGTNLAALTTACRGLHEYELPDVFLALADPLFLAKGISHIKESVEHHAGELEISHVWYKYPSLIKAAKLPDTQVDVRTIMSDFVHNDLFGKGGDSIEVFWNSAEQRKFAPSGSFSDSSKASPEKGKIYHEYMVDNLSRFVEWLKKYDGIIGND